MNDEKYIRFSDFGIELLKRLEGFESKPYRDAQGWSIGYGHYLGKNYPYSIQNGISVKEAETFMIGDIKAIENQLKSYPDVLAALPFQNMYDAIIIFIYNIGIGNFTQGTVDNKIRQRKYAAAADTMLKYIYYTNKDGQKVESKGLKLRRIIEVNLFMYHKILLNL